VPNNYKYCTYMVTFTPLVFRNGMQVHVKVAKVRVKHNQVPLKAHQSEIIVS